jgi:hypothetical protein
MRKRIGCSDHDSQAPDAEHAGKMGRTPRTSRVLLLALAATGAAAWVFVLMYIVYSVFASPLLGAIAAGMVGTWIILEVVW